jgi:hypothetical protein
MDGPERKERENTSIMALGMTHFDNYELNEICKYTRRLTRVCAMEAHHVASTTCHRALSLLQHLV